MLIYRKICYIIFRILCFCMAKINDLCDGSMDQRKVRGLVPCCDQDGYRAQVPQHPIDSYNIFKFKSAVNLSFVNVRSF